MKKLNQLMQRLPKGVDCGLIVSPCNRRYFTRFSSTDGALVVMRDKTYFLVDFRYYEKAAQQIQGCEVILMERLYEQLRELLAKHQCVTVAVENDRMTLAQFNRFKRELPDCRLDGSDRLTQLIETLRIQKTPDEIYEILTAQELTERAFEHVLGFIEPGRTEKQVALVIDQYIRTHGADGIAFPTIAVSGKNSSSPHGVPTDKPLEIGDFLTMDYGATVNGYHSDMTRTVVLGHADQEMRRVYQTVLAGQKMALAEIRAGKTCKEIDGLVRQFFDRMGYQGAFGHSLGHGVGVEIHEAPVLGPRSETVLEKGMVVTVEPGIYLPGKYGVRIEDMVVVTEDGCNNLTKSEKELICL